MRAVWTGWPTRAVLTLCLVYATLAAVSLPANAPTTTLTGTLTGGLTGAGVPGAEVIVNQLIPDVPVQAGIGVTDASGHYTIGGLGDGFKYGVQVESIVGQSSQNYGSGSSESFGMLPAGNTTRDFVLPSVHVVSFTQKDGQCLVTLFGGGFRPNAPATFGWTSESSPALPPVSLGVTTGGGAIPQHTAIGPCPPPAQQVFFVDTRAIDTDPQTSVTVSLLGQTPSAAHLSVNVSTIVGPGLIYVPEDRVLRVHVDLDAAPLPNAIVSRSDDGISLLVGTTNAQGDVDTSFDPTDVPITGDHASIFAALGPANITGSTTFSYSVTNAGTALGLLTESQALTVSLDNLANPLGETVQSVPEHAAVSGLSGVGTEDLTTTQIAPGQAVVWTESFPDLERTQPAVVLAPSVSIGGDPTGPIPLGTAVTLMAEVSQGIGPFDYRWTKDGVAVGNALTMTDVPLATSTYTLAVTDAFGLVSNAASTTVVIADSSGGNSGGGCTADCPPPLNATPELDSLVLFGSGLSGLVGYALLRRRARK